MVINIFENIELSLFSSLLYTSSPCCHRGSLISTWLHNQDPLTSVSLFDLPNKRTRRENILGSYSPVSLTANPNLTLPVFLCIRPYAEKHVYFFKNWIHGLKRCVPLFFFTINMRKDKHLVLFPGSCITF